MPKCTEDRIEFGRVGRRVIEADFSGGDLSSEGGLLLLRQMDERLGLNCAAAHALGDDKRSRSVVHSLHSTVAQRVYGLCLGWPEVCGHNSLRDDLGLFGRRASCHRFWANQLRLLLAALAYTLMINLRGQALAGTALAQACTTTIRTRLLKIGAAIVRNSRRVRVMLASAHPLRGLHVDAARALAAGP